MSRDLEQRIEGLRREYDADKDFPNVLAAWQAIQRIAAENKERAVRGDALVPFPEWLNDYLLRCGDKIGRLWLGIKPDDGREIRDIGADNVGELRRAERGQQTRDVRGDYVTAALGFTIKGKTVFQKVDQVVRDQDYLSLYDDPDYSDNEPLKKEVRRIVLDQMMKQENITKAAALNRLSAARTKRQMLMQS